MIYKILLEIFILKINFFKINKYFIINTSEYKRINE
jgi:hypothetical protein